jgi:hypothetical protein
VIEFDEPIGGNKLSQQLTKRWEKKFNPRKVSSSTISEKQVQKDTGQI